MSWARHCRDQLSPFRIDCASELQGRIALIQAQTLRAIHRPDDPEDSRVFSSFAGAVARHRIPHFLVLSCLSGLAAEARGGHFRDGSDLLRFASSLEGALAQMVFRTLGVDGEEDRTRIADLGAAVLLNRTIGQAVEDQALGRCFLPDEWLREEGLTPRSAAAPEHRDRLARVAARVLGMADSLRQSGSRILDRLPWPLAARLMRGILHEQELGRRIRALGPRAWDAPIHFGVAHTLSVHGAAVSAVAWSGIRKAVPRIGVHLPRPRS